MAMLFQGQDGPLISVVMPVYNAEPYLSDAIQSILAQTYSHFEFIIVDDGSTDGSAGIVHDFAARDSRIRPLYLCHRGQSFALNDGIALAQGRFVAHMDNDDIALPDRFAAQLAWMRQNELDICGGCLRKFGDRDGLIWFPETHEAIRFEFLFRIALHHGTSLVRAEIAKNNLFAAHVLHTDYEMLTRLARHHRLGNMPRVLLKHRCHARQAHVKYQSTFLADLRKFRRPYFHTLFPEATEEDYAALARVSDKKPLPDLTALERAGRWLVRLAQTPDAFLRRRMADRWRASCQRSAHLGFGCCRIYRRFAPRFGVPADQGSFKIWLACALKLRENSAAHSFLARIWRTRTGLPRQGRYSRP